MAMNGDGKRRVSERDDAAEKLADLSFPFLSRTEVEAQPDAKFIQQRRNVSPGRLIGCDSFEFANELESQRDILVGRSLFLRLV